MRVETIEITTRSRTECVDITREVKDIVSKAGAATGAALVCSLHTTAGLMVNESADPDVAADVLATLSLLAPKAGPYAHSEGNSDAHVKAALVGSSVIVPIEAGGLVLGTWQGIYFCEFDGPRRRRVAVQILPGS